jgi:hypothetical protein
MVWRMNGSQTAIALFALVLSYRVLQIRPPEAGRKTIIVRMLNGVNEKPASNEYPYVWMGAAKRHRLNLRTDSHGEIVLDVTNAQPDEIRMMPNYNVDCRFAGDQNVGKGIRYSVEDIISKGMVGDNVCGTSHVLPTPGVLVLYVRPRTFKERWKLL